MKEYVKLVEKIENNIHGDRNQGRNVMKNIKVIMCDIDGTLLNSKGIEIYNLGTGIGYSVLDVVNSFEHVYFRLRLVVDYISGMTDGYAVEIHNVLK